MFFCLVWSWGLKNKIIVFFCHFQIEEEVEKLKALKLELTEDGAANPGSGKVILKTAKGTRDYQPEQV